MGSGRGRREKKRRRMAGVAENVIIRVKPRTSQ